MIESLFIDGDAPDGIEGADRYCRALRVIWDMADAMGHRRRVPEVSAEGGSRYVLTERFKLPGRPEDVHRRLVEVVDGDRSTVLVDGLPLERYVRLFAAADGDLRGFAFAFERNSKSEVAVFDCDFEQMGGAVTEDVEAPVDVVVTGPFGTYDSFKCYPYQREGRRIWLPGYRLQPLAPRGIEQVVVRGSDGNVVLDPHEDPVWRSHTLADFLRHGAPECVDLDLADDVAGSRVGVEITASERTSPGRFGTIIENWITVWNEYAGGEIALVIGRESGRIVAKPGIELIVALHDLSASLEPRVRREDATVSVRLTPA